MTKMRVALLTAAMVLTVGGSAMADDKVVVGDILKFGNSWGTLAGEYIATEQPPQNNVAFETFCVQTSEYLNFGDNTFKVTGVSTKSVYATPHDLMAETAYLYSNFRAGTLAGYKYATDTLANQNLRIASADQLQQAIWYFQGQAGGVNNAFAQAATAAVTGPSPTWAGFGDVRILNLVWEHSDTGGFSTGMQAQDVLTTVPEPAFFQMGALLGMSGVGFLRLRRKA
ncbi:MAG: hypothetical protein WCL39_15525 [Armatimonadota bacterium]